MRSLSMRTSRRPSDRTHDDCFPIALCRVALFPELDAARARRASVYVLLWTQRTRIAKWMSRQRCGRTSLASRTPVNRAASAGCGRQRRTCVLLWQSWASRYPACDDSIPAACCMGGKPWFTQTPRLASRASAARSRARGLEGEPHSLDGRESARRAVPGSQLAHHVVARLVRLDTRSARRSFPMRPDLRCDTSAPESMTRAS